MLGGQQIKNALPEKPVQRDLRRSVSTLPIGPTQSAGGRDRIWIVFRAGKPPDSIDANRYQYGDGNPLQTTDPTGHWGWNPFKAVKKAVQQLRTAILAQAKGSALEELLSWTLMHAESKVPDVESLISNPALMTHASVPLERRGDLGLSEGLIRLSCGVEDVNDLLSDLEHALDGV